MAVTRKPELSKTSPYYLPKERYYELKHFCLQAPAWEKAYEGYCSIRTKPELIRAFAKKYNFEDPTEKAAEAALFLSKRIDLIKDAAEKTNKTFGLYLYEAVTRNRTYDQMKAMHPEMPCGRTYWYDIYRKFFWLLSKSRK